MSRNCSFLTQCKALVYLYSQLPLGYPFTKIRKKVGLNGLKLYKILWTARAVCEMLQIKIFVLI